MIATMHQSNKLYKDRLSNCTYTYPWGSGIEKVFSTCVPLACRQRQLNGLVFRIRPQNGDLILRQGRHDKNSSLFTYWWCYHHMNAILNVEPYTASRRIIYNCLNLINLIILMFPSVWKPRILFCLFVLNKALYIGSSCRVKENIYY